jgi:cardiolipin synthase
MPFLIVSIVAIVITGTLLLLVLFEPGLRYDVQEARHSLDSPEFLCLLGALSDAQIHRQSRIEVLSSSDAFYEAELEAIRSAKRSINLEAFIFRRDAMGRRFVEALTERARSGVRVNLVVDAIGCLKTWNSTFTGLRKAGGRVRWYQPLRWYTLKRFNNRTHRELLVIDGQVGFIGGAGIGDWWTTGSRFSPPWRDTVVRVTGDLVAGLQTTFAENWLEAAEEILTGDEYFPTCCIDRAPVESQPAEPEHPDAANAAGIVVISTPSAGRSTRARLLFQMLLASARRTIRINSPYFLPDRSVQRELLRAVARGVKVQVVVPSEYNNHPITRHASRRRYGHLLRNGIEIYEYQPSMIHVKCLIVDEVWSVIGSTNFDNRSFGLNDEVNLAAQSPALAQRLCRDFERDMSNSEKMTLEKWRRRSLWEKFLETVGRLVERQQ